MGYIIMVRNAGGWFGNMIEKKQKQVGFDPEDAKYTHVEVSSGGPDSIRIAPPKTIAIDITKTYKGRFIRIVRYKDYTLEGRERCKVACFFASLCNMKYDVTGVLSFMSFLLKWLRKNNRLYFCSEGCLWALQKEYPKALNGMNPNECMPAEFNNPEYFEKVWEGIIE